MSGLFARFSGSGSQTAFTLPQPVAAASDVIVTLNGLRQDPGVDYSIAGTTLTMVVPPPGGSILIAEQSIGASTSTLKLDGGDATGSSSAIIINGGTA